MKRALARSMTVCALCINNGCSPPHPASSSLPARPERDPVVVTTTAPSILFDVERFQPPKDWAEGGSIVHLEPVVDAEARQHATEVVRSALAKYPPELLVAELKTVWIARSMSVGDAAAGGTWLPGQIVVATEFEDSRVEDRLLERAAHHELSSVLAAPRDSWEFAAKWRACNPPGFRYFGSSMEFVKSGERRSSFAEADLRDGFVWRYGRATMDDDRSCYAQELFCGNPRLWVSANYFPRVKQKLDLTIRFYEGLSPIFTEEYFRGFATRGMNEQK